MNKLIKLHVYNQIKYLYDFFFNCFCIYGYSWGYFGSGGLVRELFFIIGLILYYY
jgi:hypothetical protein